MSTTTPNTFGLSPESYQQMIVEWNSAQVALPDDLRLHPMIEAQVQRTPDAVAVVYKGDSITYRELDERSNQFGHYLQSQGVGPEVVVGISVETSVNMIVALLGILKAGGAYVPLDPNFPPNRIAYMLENSGAPILVTEEGLVENMPNFEGTRILLDADWDTHVAGQPVTSVQSDVQGHHLSYIIYTSGSTGLPKGVVVERQHVVNFMVAMDAVVGSDEPETWLSVTTPSFDPSVFEYFWSLSHGFKIVLYDGHRLRADKAVGSDDGDYGLLALMERHKPTYLQMTPHLARTLVQNPAIREALAPFKYVMLGGEAFPPEVAVALQEAVGGDVLNLYGPTEATVWSATWTLRGETGQIPIGRPIPNVSYYLLDEHQKPVPLGETGEIFIGGPGVVRGYHNLPDKTAERFLPDPFAGDGGRMYRTGDLARYREDGVMEFLGRIDHQVKIRGNRIELGEIETQTFNFGGIKQAVTLAHEDTPGDIRLAVYYTVEPGVEIDKQALREHLEERVPHYAVPFHYIQLEAFPQTPSGKIDRKALSAPETEAKSAQAYVAPRNDLETWLADAWAEVLGVDRVGIHDNFFDIGGHSMLAIQIFARIRQEYGRDLPLATLFHAATVAQLAPLVDPNADESSFKDMLNSVVVPIKPTGTLPPFFCVGGGVLNMRELASRLDDNQPFYGLQWQSLSDEQVMDVSVEAAASAFIDGIRSVQPEGPYYLGGSFAAGVIAVEIARQLEEAGDEVALLVGFDAVTGQGGVLKEQAGDAAAAQPVKRSRAERIVRLLKKGPGHVWERLLDYDYEENIQHAVWNIVMAFYERIGQPVPARFRQGMFEEFFILRANEQHKPKGTYQGPFELYLTPDRYKNMSAYVDWSWSTMVDGPIRVEQVTGNPCSIMLDPNVDQLATHLRSRLAQTYRERGLDLEALAQ